MASFFGRGTEQSRRNRDRLTKTPAKSGTGYTEDAIYRMLTAREEYISIEYGDKRYGFAAAD